VLEDVERVELAPPALERLDQIHAPTLILLGGHDLEATKEAAERLCSGIRHVQRIDWPDTAHLPSLEHPDRFTDLLRGWLSPAVGEPTQPKQTQDRTPRPFSEPGG
jgi:3-oxoadipate enol-lactonase